MSKTESSKTLAAIDHLDIWSGAWQKKAGTGRGKNGKLTPYGIQKLRELILELAVRGRLVPQDPNDEPASVLLEKIAEEKAQLVKEGKSQDLCEHGIGVVRIGDVTKEGRISTDKMLFFPEEKLQQVDKKFLVHPGDLVITMTGDVKVGFNKNDRFYLLNQRVGKLDVFIVKQTVFV